MTQFEDVFDYIGEFGRYQFLQYVIVCLPAIFVAAQAMNFVFVALVPNHRCRVNGTADSYNLVNGLEKLLPNNSLREFFDNRLPLEKDSDANYRYDRCNMYTDGRNLTSCKNGWVFAHDTMDTTIIEEAGLICNKQVQQTLAAMIFFLGVFVGALVFGIMSDKAGRKKTLCLSLVLMLVFSLASCLATEFYSFASLKFLIGMSTSGIFLTAFVLALELVGPSWRTFTGIMIQNFWSVGLVMLGGLAYFVRNWQWLQFATSIPFVLFIGYYWIIPCSARWMLMKGRKDEVEKVIRRAANFNKRTIPNKFFEDLEVEADVSSNDASLLDLFRSGVWASRTVIICFNWGVIAMTYYGLSMSVSSLGGNLFLNTIINGGVEIPANLLCIAVLDKLGRKPPHILGMLLGAFGCIAFAILAFVFSAEQAKNEYAWVFLFFYFVGKFGCTMGFSIIYIWSAEIFPTVVRTTSIGLSSMIARVGSLAAPVIADSGKFVSGPWKRALPLAIFGGLTLVAGTLAFFLPETLGEKLPETIEEGKLLGKKPKENQVDSLEMDIKQDSQNYLAYSTDL